MRMQEELGFDDVDGDLSNCTTADLIEKIRKLKLHVKQLRNVIHKSNQDASEAEPKRKKARKEREFNFDIHHRRHIALKVAYLGWDYHGLASQEDSDQTIEAHLFNALLKTKLIKSRETANYQRCGRTDKGVSAFQQVFSLDLRCKSTTGIGVLPPFSVEVPPAPSGLQASDPPTEVEEINYAGLLNKVLPKEIRVCAWAPVPSGFSARYDCLYRLYKYYFPSNDLDISRVREAINFLTGVHDFRNLSKLDRTGKKSSIREILEVDLEDVDGDDTMMVLRIKGRSFVWHQIRCIVAVLLLIGKGLEQPSVIKELLDVKQNPKKPQYSMAADFPLVLFEVSHGDIPWIVDNDTVEGVRRDFHLIALQHQIKTSMILDFLSELPERNPGGSELFLVDSLLMGKDGKVHKPLMSRPLCLRTPPPPELPSVSDKLSS